MWKMILGKVLRYQQREFDSQISCFLLLYTKYLLTFSSTILCAWRFCCSPSFHRVVQDNADGIRNDKDSTGNKISIKQVRSNGNVGSTSVAKYGIGMHLFAGEIIVEDSEASGNFNKGILVDSNQGGTTSVVLKGSISVRHNKGEGLVFSSKTGTTLTGTLDVDGKVNIYGNHGNGVRFGKRSSFRVDVKKGKSLTSCKNAETIANTYDISIQSSGASFGDNGFTCGTENGSPQPNCAECPSCPSP